MITRHGDVAGHVTARISTRFSADGSLAACLAGDGTLLQPEVWSFTANTDRSRSLPTPDGETVATQLLPLSTDRALLVRHEAQAHELVSLEATSAGVRERHLTTMSTAGFRLLASHDPHAPALAVSWEPPDRTTVWRVLPHAPWLERRAEVAGHLTGGVGLDIGGRGLGFTHHDENGTRAVRLDMVDGSVRPLWTADGSPRTHVLGADPYSGLVMVAVETARGSRLAYVHQRGSSSPGVVWPSAPADLEGAVLPLAVSPGGELVALKVRAGARSRLFLHHVARDELTEVGIPPGVIDDTAAWSFTGLRFLYSSPVCPTTMVTVNGGAITGTECRLAGATLMSQPWRHAHVERFQGPAGDIEAVVYGDWRASERVVVMLHGGPSVAWEFDYQPMLRELAIAGIAIIAPNQRGSTGYGHTHAEAIRNAWGGPDRDDVCALGEIVSRHRGAGLPAPMLYGESYGGYLALLTAAHRPDLWSRCAVVAPFLSGARLHDEASPAVRELIDRLGGRTPLPEGTNDVLAVAGHIRAPLLIVHGDSDRTVPVSQSRRLRRHLREMGRREPTDVQYREIHAADHDPLTHSRSETAKEELWLFLNGFGPHPDPRGRLAMAIRSTRMKGGEYS